MNKFYTLISLFCISGALVLSGCGISKTTSTSNKVVQENASSPLANILNGISANESNSDSQNSTTPINSGSIISGIIGKLTSSVAETKITGTWSYTEPTIQFESENFLAKAGGIAVAKTIVDKIKPFYERLNMNKGFIIITLSDDGTCVFNMNGNEYPCNYDYDKENNIIVFNSSIGFNISAFVTVSSTNLTLTFDTKKLLTIAQTFGANSTNSTISTLSSLAAQYNGMKTGFLFERK